ncbi:hypothetical protein M0802_008739 [Mischocyttarus mexicanus]|nr:hypothetical protein M0802_008739 [Mischocyttarus mexicanus]
MFNITKIRRPLYMAVYPIKEYWGNFDTPTNPIVDEMEATPMGRIKKIFISTEIEPLSKELQNFINFTSTASLVGIAVGGLFYTRGVAQDFIDNNEATRFYNHMDAKRSLQKKVTIQFAKGAYRFGWRLTLFSGIYEFIRMMLTAYYGHHSILHYMIGAGVAGFLFKLSLGLKGSLVGLVVGTVLGAIGGSFILLFLKLTGMSLEDFERIHQYWSYKKEEVFKEAVGKRLEEEFGEAKNLHSEIQDMQKRLSLTEVESQNVKSEEVKSKEVKIEEVESKKVDK